MQKAKRLQTSENQIIDEMLALGILKQERGQITLDSGFLEVLQAELCNFRMEPKKSIINIIRHYFPSLGKNRVLSYAAFIEAYMLQN